MVLRQIVVTLQVDHVLLEGGVDRNARFLTLEHDFIFLLAGRVDAFLAGSLLGVAQGTEDLAGRVLEVLQTAEGVDVDRDEEMAEMIRLLLAFGAEAEQLLQEAALLQRSAQDFNDRRIAVALVAGRLFAQAAQRRQSGFALHEVDQDLVGIRTGVALFVDDPAGRKLLARTAIDFDLAALRDGRRAVEEERERLIRRHAEGQRVRSEHVLDAEGRGDGRTGVRARDTDHAVLDGHQGVVAGDAVVGGVADDRHAHAVFAGVVDGVLHGLLGGDHAHAVMRVDDGGRRRLLDEFDGGLRVEDAVADAVDVDGFQAADTVGVDAALVGGDQNVRADLRVFERHAGADQRIAHEVFKCLEIKIVDFVFHDVFLIVAIVKR